MRLNVLYIRKTHLPEALPFIIREEVFSCTALDYINNWDTLRFEPTDREPHPPNSYVRRDMYGKIRSVILTSRILTPGSAHPMTIVKDITFHYGELDTVFRTRKIKTFIPLFKLHKIERTLHLFGPMQMNRTDMATLRYHCEGGLTVTNVQIRKNKDMYAMVSFDFDPSGAEYIAEFMDEEGIDAQRGVFKAYMKGLLRLHLALEPTIPWPYEHQSRAPQQPVAQQQVPPQQAVQPLVFQHPVPQQQTDQDQAPQQLPIRTRALQQQAMQHDNAQRQHDADVLLQHLEEIAPKPTKAEVK